MSTADRMSPLEIRASVSLASIFALRMLGLFLIMPVFAVHARGLAGAQDPQISATLIGIALGIYGLTQGALQIPFGALSDRYGRKPLIVFGLVLFAAGSFIAAAADDIWMTIVGRAVQGAGAISAAVTAFIADATRDQHRTKAMAMVGASIGLTFAFSLVAAPPLYTAIGIGGLFAATGVLAIAAIGVVVWVVPPAPPRIRHENPAHWLDVVMHPELFRLNFGIFALHTVLMASFVVVPVLLVERGGLPLADHWRVYLPVVLASFALMMPPILAAERRGRMRALFLGAIATLAAVHLGYAWMAPSLGWLALWLLLFFVAFNILEASLPSLVSRMAPTSHKGLALGVYNTTQAIGLFAGGAAGGWLVARFGGASVFYAGAALLVVWWLFAARMREPTYGTQGEPPAAAGAAPR